MNHCTIISLLVLMSFAGCGGSATKTTAVPAERSTVHRDGERSVQGKTDPDAKQIAQPPSEPAAELADWREIDPDAEKVLILADFESEDEIVNVSNKSSLRTKELPSTPYAQWLGNQSAPYRANRLELSDEHVFHGHHSLAVHANAGTEHFPVPTLEDSFPPDWSDYDAIRFHLHCPADTRTWWIFRLRLRYTDEEGKDKLALAKLMYHIHKGSRTIEIPLAAFDDLEWSGPVNGFGGGINAMTKKRTKVYEYFHEHGWPFDRVEKMTIGWKDGHDKSVANTYWLDYVRLVKKKQTDNGAAHEAGRPDPDSAKKQ